MVNREEVWRKWVYFVFLFFFPGCWSVFQPCRYCRHPRNKPAGGRSTKLIILKGWFGLSARKMHRWELSSGFPSSLGAETPAAKALSLDTERSHPGKEKLCPSP